MEHLIKNLLTQLGENPEREGLLKTPHRVSESLKFLTSGYKMNIDKIVNEAIYNEKYDEMVIVKDIDFFSLCEHHLLPFFGKCHIAYLPDGKLIGLSKVARIVEMFSRRLQIQERLTCEIADTMQEILKPLGVAVVMSGLHLCMVMRGVEKQNAIAVTSSMLGVFREEENTRMEFMNLLEK